MKVKIEDLYAIAFNNPLKKPNPLTIYPRLFIDKEEAEKIAKDVNGVVQSVFL